MRPGPHRNLVACAIAFAGALSVSEVHAQASGASASGIAEGLFRQGQKLLGEGKIHDACDAFAASQKAEPAVGTLLNVAACHEKEGRTATAWAEFDDAIATARRLDDKPRETYARAHLAALEKRLRRVTVTVANPLPEMEIAIDGTPLARSAWAAGVPLDPGEHAIRATAPGKKASTKTFAVSADAGTERVEVPELEDEAAAPIAPAPLNATPVPPPAASPPSSTTARTAGFLAGGAGVALLGIATFFEISALGAASDRDALCGAGKPCASDQAYRDASDAHDRAKTRQTIGIVAGTVGLVALGAGAWLVFSARGRAATAQIDLAPRGPGGELRGTVTW